MKHIFDKRSERCIGCGATRLDVEGNRAVAECFSAIVYREYLVGSTWIREPIYSSNHPLDRT